MKIRAVFIYLAVALALFSYIYFIDSDRLSTQERARLEREPLDFKTQDVQSLKLSRASGATFEFQKRRNRWFLQQPIEAMANADEVYGLLSSLRYARVLRTTQSGEMPAGKWRHYLEEWGLAKPQVTIEWSTPEKRYRLLIGRKTPREDAVWARLSDGEHAPVHVLSARAVESLDKTLEQFRSRLLFDFSPVNVLRAAVAVRGADGNLRSQTEVIWDKSEVAWKLKNPVVAAVDRDRLMQWLRALGQWNVVEFVSDAATNPGQFGLANPQAQLTIRLKDDPQEQVLLIGGAVPGKPGQVYVKWQGQPSVMTLPEAPVREALAALSGVRNRKLLATIDPAFVRGIRWMKDGKVVEVSQHLGRWQIDQAPGLPEKAAAPSDAERPLADTEAVRDWLKTLVRLEAESFVQDAPADLKPYGLAKPQATLTLRHLSGAKPPEVVVQFARNPKKPTQWLATVSTGNVVVAMPPQFDAAWPKEAKAFQARNAAPAPETEGTGVPRSPEAAASSGKL